MCNCEKSGETTEQNQACCDGHATEQQTPEQKIETAETVETAKQTTETQPTPEALPEASEGQAQ